MELPSPVISDAVIEEIRQNEVLGFKLLDATFPLSRRGRRPAREPASRSQSDAERAVHDGYHVLCVSRQGGVQARASTRSRRCSRSAAVHNYLCQQGLRDRCSLVVQAGDIQEGHDICVPGRVRGRRRSPVPDAPAGQGRADLQGPGTKQEIDARPAASAWRTCSPPSRTRIKKVISKMGITTIEGYRGAQLFEAVGFGPELMEFLGDFPSRDRRHRPGRAGRGRPVAAGRRPRR